MSKFSYKTIAINTYQDFENCVLYMFKQYSNVTNILISYFQILGYVVKYKKALVLDYILSHYSSEMDLNGLVLQSEPGIPFVLSLYRIYHSFYSKEHLSETRRLIQKLNSVIEALLNSSMDDIFNKQDEVYYGDDNRDESSSLCTFPLQRIMSINWKSSVWKTKNPKTSCCSTSVRPMKSLLVN